MNRYKITARHSVFFSFIFLIVVYRSGYPQIDSSTFHSPSDNSIPTPDSARTASPVNHAPATDTDSAADKQNISDTVSSGASFVTPDRDTSTDSIPVPSDSIPTPRKSPESPDTLSTPAQSPPDKQMVDSTSVTIDGVLIVKETGAPPRDSTLLVRIDTQNVIVSSDGEFTYSTSRKKYYTISVTSQRYAPVQQTVTFSNEKYNYFITIVLEPPSARQTVTQSETAVDTALIPWTITGTIIDSRFETGIISQNFTLRFDGEYVPVSNKGNFTVTTHLSGNHTLYLSVPGYQQITRTVTCTDEDKQPFVVLATTVIGKVIKRREMTVTAAALPVHRTASVAKVELPRKELIRSTATLNDPIRALHTLPGVTSESDIASRPVVRGGDVLESRVFLDGISLIQPYHFGGIRSIFNQLSLSNLTLYKSGYPAEFHNAQSAIINAESRIPSNEKLSADGDVNFLQYSLYGGVPLLKGTFGLNFSAQGSYYDAVSKLMFRLLSSSSNNEEVEQYSQLINLPDYRDFSFGASFTPSSRLQLFVNNIHNSDRTKFCYGDSVVDVTYHYDEQDYFYRDSVWKVLPETSVTVQEDYSGSYGPISDIYYPMDYSDSPDSPGPLYYLNYQIRHDGDPTVGKPYFDIDTMLNYASRYNILYAMGKYTLSDDHLFTLSTAWQKRWWDLDFPEAAEFLTETVYDVNINQYNGNFGWFYTGLADHTIKSGLQIDYTRADYEVSVIRMLHEFIVNGSTNFSDLWGPFNGDTARSLFSQDNIYGEIYFESLLEHFIVNFKGKRRYYNYGFYLNDSWEISPNLHGDIGTRVEYSTSDDAGTFSPRLSLRYNIHKNHELIGAVGHYTQNNYNISAIALATDLKPEKVWHGSIGAESRLLSWLTQKIDLYGKYYYDLLTEVFVQVSIDEYIRNRVVGEDGYYDMDDFWFESLPEEFSSWLYRSTYSSKGKGYSFGAEYMLRFNPFDFWHGWLSCSWGRSLRQRKKGWRWHAFPLDRPLLLSIHNYYRLPKNYTIGLKYRYMSGIPYTSYRSDSSGIYIGAFNAKRYAPYHRLDIRFSKGFTLFNTKFNYYTEIWNAMNAPNLFHLDGKTRHLVTFAPNLPTTLLYLGLECTF